jgi:hypothetical protein
VVDGGTKDSTVRAFGAIRNDAETFLACHSLMAFSSAGLCGASMGGYDKGQFARVDY